MEKITRYVASDGEAFKEEEECKKYEAWANDTEAMERELLVAVTNNENILMLDENFKKVIGDTDDVLYNMEYLFFKNYDSVLTYSRCAVHFGLKSVCSDFFGTWLKYNDNWDEWESIDNELEKLTSLKSKLTEAKYRIDLEQLNRRANNFHTE